MSSPIRNLPIMGVRQFRDSFPNLTEATRVIRASRGMEVLGVWTPDPRRKAKRAKESKGDE